MPEKVLHIADQVGIFHANDGQTISRRMGIAWFDSKWTGETQTVNCRPI
jgi:hypothetical protein